MVTNLEALAMGIVVSAVATIYFAIRLTVELLVGAGYQRLLRDVARAEARMRELDALERSRPSRRNQRPG